MRSNTLPGIAVPDSRSPPCTSLPAGETLASRPPTDTRGLTHPVPGDRRHGGYRAPGRRRHQRRPGAHQPGRATGQHRKTRRATRSC